MVSYSEAKTITGDQKIKALKKLHGPEQNEAKWRMLHIEKCLDLNKSHSTVTAMKSRTFKMGYM